MTTTSLLIDIGNTRIKWAWLDQGQLQPQSASPHADWTAQTFIEVVGLASIDVARVLVSNVAGPRMAQVIRAGLAQAGRVEPEFVTSTATAGGVRNAYSQPAQLGVDRWLAIIGAHALERGPVCVVSVGTAMTIDGVGANGLHLGGVIVPGPDLMMSSLLRNTSELAERAKHGSTSPALFADNTLGAIRQGAEHAAAALVERAVAVMRQLNESPQLLLTGGGGERLGASLELPHRHIPDLVLQGLRVLGTHAAAP
jgi:type III pantothenate kinase